MEILMLYAVAGLIGWGVGKMMFGMKGWRKVHKHSCGYVEDFYLYKEVCKGCGKSDDNWQQVSGREAFPFGWELREDKQP